MKRPPGLWFLLSAGVLWLSLQDVYGIRATALIFGKSTTTTTTEGSAESSSDETGAESSTELAPGNTTVKSNLTGIPQLDYIWDPNLPKELNGYNLSEYPFYERVPENIDFKCDGLHDGFYASVLHKCQVYHHCLFGTRFDFLCANYTAFDQKTFICHFVSEVDCVNSKKYWHRNDALYEAASTTTIKPVIVYTPPPQPPPGISVPRRPLPGGRRRPLRRRRPQYEYYDYDEEYDDDEYYSERPRSDERRRRKRPRPRPRPVYDDEYEEYEDERFDRRGGNRRDEERRKPHDRPDDRRSSDDRKTSDDRRSSDDRKISDERRGSDDRKTSDERRTSDDRKISEDRRPSERRRVKDRRKHEETDKFEDEEEDRKIDDNKRTSDRRSQKRRPADDYVEDDTRKRPRPKGSRRPVADDYEDELPLSEKVEPVADKPIIKPSSGSSIYDRPRTAPRIKPPVPKTEANKYSYKLIGGKTPLADEEEYYDDYEEEVLPKKSKNHRNQQASESRRHLFRREEDKPLKHEEDRPSRREEEKPSRREEEKPSRHEEVKETRKQSSSTPRPRPKPSRDEYEDGVAPRRAIKDRPIYGSFSRDRNRSNTSKKPPVEEDYYEDYEEEPSKDDKPAVKVERNKPSTTTTSTTTIATTTRASTTITKELPRENVVRVVKRPFLPSRGGNPYSARGLQPVGAKAIDKKPDIKDESSLVESYEQSKTEGEDEVVPFKPSPVIVKLPARQKYPPQFPESQEEFKPVSNRPQTPFRQNHKPNKDFSGPRTTQKPKLPDPLDIVDEEYDVTLNDALNPTLPNLPVRGFPTGFSSNDYPYNSFQRQRYVAEPIVNPSSTDYVYHQAKPARQRYETVAQTFGSSQDQFVNTNADYKGQYSTIQGQNYRPRVTQAYYSTY